MASCRFHKQIERNEHSRASRSAHNLEIAKKQKNKELSR